MNDEQILLDDLNAFEDFMENTDVEEIKKEHGLSTAHIKPKFQKCSSSFFSISISNIKNDVITLHNRESFIDVALFSCNDGYYCFVQSDFIHGISFSNKNNNIYGLLLKEVNSWIISDFPLYSVNSVQSYLDLYYKHNPVIKSNVDLEVVQGEIVESPEDIHNRICNNFAIVEKTLYEICVDLKSIRDNKHYKTLGYNTFEDYCLENFNITRRTGSKYLSIGSLPNSFGKSTSHFGAEKLYILSRLTDEERSELIQTTDIEHTPVKQLEQKSREIKENREVQVKENDVSDNMALEININPDKPTLTFKDICSISFESSSLSKGCLFTYDNSCINNDLLSNYDYLTKTFNKLVSGKYDYNNLDTLSDLIEVSRRLADGIYDLKQYLKKKESN